MATAMLKGLPNLLINGRLLSFKKSKRNSNKKSKRVGKIKATENSDESSSAKTSTTGSGPQIRVNGAPAATPPTTAKPLKATSLVGKLFQAMKFNGPAPESINGRCAMIGFPTMVLFERSENQTFLTLLNQHKFLVAFVILIISVASMVPIVKEARNERFGFMTPKFEMFSSRAAMIGFLAVIVFEAKIGTNFF